MTTHDPTLQHTRTRGSFLLMGVLVLTVAILFPPRSIFYRLLIEDLNLKSLFPYLMHYYPMTGGLAGQALFFIRMSSANSTEASEFLLVLVVSCLATLCLTLLHNGLLEMAGRSQIAPDTAARTDGGLVSCREFAHVDPVLLRSCNNGSYHEERNHGWVCLCDRGLAHRRTSAPDANPAHWRGHSHEVAAADRKVMHLIFTLKKDLNGGELLLISFVVSRDSYNLKRSFNTVILSESEGS